MNLSFSPNLSEQQKKKFQQQFSELISLCPESIQKLWVQDGIQWVDNIPHYINDVHLKLKGKTYGRYMELRRRLDSGTI